MTMMRLILISVASSSLTSFLLLAAGCDAFASPAAGLPARARLVPPTMDEGNIRMHPYDGEDGDCGGRGDAAAIDRRSALRLATTMALSSAMILAGGAAHAENETMERGGVRLTPFNSLAFNYRGAFFYATRVHFLVGGVPSAGSHFLAGRFSRSHFG
jgi:hypothetical protein